MCYLILGTIYSYIYVSKYIVLWGYALHISLVLSTECKFHHMIWFRNQPLIVNINLLISSKYFHSQIHSYVWMLRDRKRKKMDWTASPSLSAKCCSFAYVVTFFKNRYNDNHQQVKGFKKIDKRKLCTQHTC